MFFILFVYFFGGLECVGHSFAYVAHLSFLRDVCIRTQSSAVASWRATDLATHPPEMLPVERVVVNRERGTILAPLYSLASLYKYAKACPASPVGIRRILSK
jgi:hypothetical protein